MKFLTHFLLLWIVIAFSACENKSCTDVVCPGVNSTCIDGQCYCAAGYEGDNCDELSYEKFVGSYQVQENCTTTFSGYVNQNYTASISPGFRLEIITISNFANRGLPVDVTIVDATYLVITDQTIGALDVSGGEGTYEVFYNRVVFDYNYTASNNFHSCRAYFTKF